MGGGARYHNVFIGNCCILKPSEYAVAFSNLMVELIPKYLDQVSASLCSEEDVVIVKGG